MPRRARLVIGGGGFVPRVEDLFAGSGLMLDEVNSVDEPLVMPAGLSTASEFLASRMFAGALWLSVRRRGISDERAASIDADAGSRDAVGEPGSWRMGGADRRCVGAQSESIASDLEVVTVDDMDIESMKMEGAETASSSNVGDESCRRGAAEHEGAETPPARRSPTRWTRSGEETMAPTPENIAPIEPLRRLDRIQDMGWRTLDALIPWAVLAVIVRTGIDPNWLPDDIGSWSTGCSAAAGYVLSQLTQRPSKPPG